MRILHMTTFLKPGGGIQTHILDLSSWLRDRGHEVFLAGHGRDRDYLAGQKFTPLPLDKVSAFERRSGWLDMPRRGLALLSCVTTLRRLIATRED